MSPAPRPKSWRPSPRANAGTVPSYGEDPLTARVEAKLKEIFETDLAAFPVATGTGANALSLSVLTPPWGAIYCHRDAHIAVDECGAPEFYTGGAKLVESAGRARQADARPSSRRRWPRPDKGVVHHVQPAAISLTQATEVRHRLSRRPRWPRSRRSRKRHGVGLHMDGARFANALAFLKAEPGGDHLARRRRHPLLRRHQERRAGRRGGGDLRQGAGRGIRLPAQARGPSLLQDALPLGPARRLSRGRSLAEERPPCQCHGQAPGRGAGGAFPAPSSPIPWRRTRSSSICRRHAIRGLQADGFQFYRWLGEDQTLLRLVTAFDTKEADVAAFIASAERHAARANEKVA